VHGDVLQLDLQELVKSVTDAAAAAAAAAAQQDSTSTTSSSSSSRRRIKVVANLPYNITKDFLVALLPQGELISELSIMIQVRQGGGGLVALLALLLWPPRVA
jgi:16S rRNA A1518/A1519 N6-dimethyltransferase RsmA/KsgA/DIM1 with predicted DNA glycosylase/AP lyase activity